MPAGRNVDVPPVLRKSRTDKAARIRFVFVALAACIVTAVSGYAFIRTLPPETNRPGPMAIPSAVNNKVPAESMQPKAGLQAQVAVTPASLPPNIIQPLSGTTGQTRPVSTARVPAEPDPAGTADHQTAALNKVSEKTPADLAGTAGIKPRAKSASRSGTAHFPAPAHGQKTGSRTRQVQQWADAGTADEQTVEVPAEPKVADPTPRHYFALGVAAQKAGQFSPAMDYYRKALTLDPSHVPALLNLAVIHMKRGSRTKAVQILEKLQAAAPANPEIVLNLGTLYIQQKKYEKARHLLEGFTASGSSHPGVLFNLAYLNQVWNRPQKALEYYDQVISLAPDHTKACLAAASVCEGQKQIDRALAYYNRALPIVEQQGPRSLELKIENRIRLLTRIAGNPPQKTGKKI